MSTVEELLGPPPQKEKRVEDVLGKPQGLVEKALKYVSEFLPQEYVPTEEEKRALSEMHGIPLEHFEKMEHPKSFADQIMSQTSPGEMIKWGVGQLPIKFPKIFEKLHIIRGAKEAEKLRPVTKPYATLPQDIAKSATELPMGGIAQTTKQTFKQFTESKGYHWSEVKGEVANKLKAEYDALQTSTMPSFKPRIKEEYTHTVTIMGEEHPAIVTKNTIPGEKPWRITWFEKDGTLISHLDINTPTDYPTKFINGWGEETKIFIKPKMGDKVSSKIDFPTQKVMPLEEHQAAMSAAIERAIQNPNDPIIIDETKRLFRRIAEGVETGGITSENLSRILERYQITPAQFSEELINSASHAGRTLNQLSQVAKQIKAAFPKDEAVEKLLGKMSRQPQTYWEIFREGYRKIDNVRRGMMVGQMATAARNAISQAGRYTLNVFDDALQGVIKTTTGTPMRDAFADVAADFTAIWNRMTPEGRKKIQSILERYPDFEAKLITTPIHDAVMGDKISRMVNILNRGQEYFFRKMAFDSKLKTLTQKAGIDPLTQEIPESILKESINHALELTYAKTPESGPGAALMRMYKEAPFLTMVQPFPRFWANAVKFLWDFNPTGYITTASKLIGKDSAGAIKAASEATIGTLMLGVAIQVRQSEYAGEKWYQFKVGHDPKTGENKYIDTRAFAPFSTYLFLAEQMLNPDRITTIDRIQGLVGINRIAGSGLAVIDILRNKDPGTQLTMLKDIAGEWLGGFTVPLRTPKDILGQFMEQEREVQTTRESSLYGPAVSNVPFLSKQILPGAERITRPGVIKREETLIRQLTGLTVQKKSKLEQEIDRLGLENLYPRTGDRELDRRITGTANKYIEKLNNFVNSESYKKATDDARAYMLNKNIEIYKEQARKTSVFYYYEPKIREMNPKDRLEFLKTRIKKGKLGVNDLQILHGRNPDLFPDKELEELIKVYLFK